MQNARSCSPSRRYVAVRDDDTVDSDPVASFRQLIALPAGGAREAPRIDPRRIRTIVDRGVVTSTRLPKPTETGQEVRA